MSFHFQELEQTRLHKDPEEMRALAMFTVQGQDSSDSRLC